MELNEAGRRIVGQHWRLILCFIVLGAAAASALHMQDVPTYTASTRLTIGTDDPKTSSESAAISDTAWALATAPSNIRAALASARITGRRVEDIAPEVSVAGVGSSSVLELSVSDPDPRAAVALADALAHEVRQARLDSSDAEQRDVLAQIDGSLGVINKKVDRLQSLPAGDPSRTAQLDSLTQQRAVLETQRTTALLDASKLPRPMIISPAVPPASADSTGRGPDILLGAILGLVLGLGIAALIETLRPTVVGGEALARELGTPLLGTLPGRGNLRADAGTPAVAGRLRLASKSAGVHNIGLLPLRRDVDLPRLTADLSLGVENRHIYPFDVRSPSLVNGGGTGIVIVAPEAPKKAELEGIRHVLALTPGPLLGVVTYSRTPAPRDPDIAGGPIREDDAAA